MPGLPAGFGSSLDLGLGGGPSTAISQVDGGPNTIEIVDGPFAVGAGASARQSNTLPVTNTSTAPTSAAAQYAGLGSGLNAGSLMMAAVAIVALLILKKKGIV
ncbi:MAG: hypothetical protein EPO08_12990 [Rhodospirillaceae bacterium]|nr:MAG: hypothetical protein EPO08_12990 [Rhodospirillaceae bacterium]